AKPERLDALEIANAVLDRAHRGLPDAEQAARVRGRVLADPLVVRRKARVLEVEVRMIAQHHADARVEDLRRHAITILIGQARVWIPAAAMELLEPGAEHRQLLGALAGRRHEPHRDRLVQPLDDEEVSALFITDDVGRAIAELRVDPGDVRVGRLCDVRGGRDDWVGHAGHRVVDRRVRWIERSPPPGPLSKERGSGGDDWPTRECEPRPWPPRGRGALRSALRRGARAARFPRAAGTSPRGRRACPGCPGY